MVTGYAEEAGFTEVGIRPIENPLRRFYGLTLCAARTVLRGINRERARSETRILTPPGPRTR